jgi:hypothetical protein
VTTTTVRYDLDAAGMRRVTAEFLAANPARGGRFVTAVVGPETDLAQVGRALERRVFEAAVREQAIRMRRASRPTPAALRRSGPRRLLVFRVASQVSTRIGTGKDIDEHIVVVTD